MICVVLILGLIFLIVCIFGLRKRADDLQVHVDDLQVQLEQCQGQLEQCIKIIEEIEVDEVNLLPCPICGHEVKLNPINDSFCIECDNFLGEDGCGLKTGYYDSKNELVEQWNGMK